MAKSGSRKNTDAGSEWITELSEIRTASDESLARSLLTLDGRGMEIKKAALEELREREYRKGRDDGFESGYNEGRNDVYTDTLQ